MDTVGVAGCWVGCGRCVENWRWPAWSIRAQQVANWSGCAQQYIELITANYGLGNIIKLGARGFSIYGIPSPQQVAPEGWRRCGVPKAYLPNVDHTDVDTRTSTCVFACGLPNNGASSSWHRVHRPKPKRTTRIVRLHSLIRERTHTRCDEPRARL